MGAVATFNYRSSSCGAEIRNYTNNTLVYALDCVAEAESMTMCYEAICSTGGKYLALNPFSAHIQYTRRDIKAEWIMGCSLFGWPVKLPGVYGRPATPGDRVFAAKMYQLAEQLLAEGALKPHPITVRDGGLECVVDGIEDLRNNRVKASKLVYPIP
jgi:aspyridone synthetase trans-acting enoyl reductase